MSDNVSKFGGNWGDQTWRIECRWTQHQFCLRRPFLSNTITLSQQDAAALRDALNKFLTQGNDTPSVRVNSAIDNIRTNRYDAAIVDIGAAIAMKANLNVRDWLLEALEHMNACRYAPAINCLKLVRHRLLAAHTAPTP